MPTAHARGAWPGGPGGGACARQEEELGFGPRREPESPSLECAGAWRLPVSPWSGKVSCGAASATRNDCGPRVRRAPLLAACCSPQKPLRPSRSPLGRGVPGRPPVPAPRSAAPRPGWRGLMAGPSPCGRTEPRSRRAPRAAGPALGPQPQALPPRVLAPSPASLFHRPFTHPSLPQCSRSRPERKGPRPRRTKPKESESRTPTSLP